VSVSCRARRRFSAALTGLTTTAVLTAAVLLETSSATAAGSATLPAALSATASAATSARVPASTSAAHRRWPGHPGRVLVDHRVRRGDTATGLAVHYHAWTAELVAVNHLGRRAHLRVGQRIRIPVVLSAWRRAHPHTTPPWSRHRTHHQTHQQTHRATHRTPWRGTGATRHQVRRLVAATARRHHVDPHLALAISWQESGWQQHRRSSAGAIGAMQVLPGTARWMSTYAGRRLNAYALRDNVVAGVLLLRVLRTHTTYRRTVAAYYQGLGSVRRDGLYPSTRRYLRSVVALHHRLRHGWRPA